MNLIERIAEEMNSDTEDLEKQSQLLQDVYLKAPNHTKELLDDAFICLCGYSLRTMIIT